MRSFFRNYRLIEILYLLAALVISAQRYFLGHYNNFKIFRYSTIHFFQKADLYGPHPDEYYDLFLYSPSFAVLFSPFSYLPLVIGISLWVFFVMAVYYYSIRVLPFERKWVLFIFGFTFIELITAVENLQTNPLIAAFIVMTFVYLEKDKIIKASIFPVLGFFIKGYGVISGVLLILKKPKFKTILYSAGWFTIFLLLPLVYYSPAGLVNLYKGWKMSLFSDHEINTGISLMGILAGVFSAKTGLVWIQITGLFFLLFTLTLIFIRKNFEMVKEMVLAYIMIWVVIFNHDAESATYIIAVTGVAIWYVKSSRSITDKILLFITFLLTVLSPTDIFPDSVYRKFVLPYSLKALGPSLVWLKIQITLLFPEKKPIINERKAADITDF